MTDLTILDLEPNTGNMLDEVVAGLSREEQKTLPCKYLYDEDGSRLFDRICDLPEYYQTRTEMQIMRDNIAEIGRCVGDEALLVEYGSGSSLKTRILLDEIDLLSGYVPIDISRWYVETSARRLQKHYPDLEILPVVADYSTPIRMPEPEANVNRRVAYFPGSTIGNFHPHEAIDFLMRVRDAMGEGGGLLLGVDLRKDPAVLHAAYNDSAGVTAAFNLGILHRINRELDADFDPDAFAHYAPFNPGQGRIEMHLVSLKQQVATVDGQSFELDPGESIWTECSYKYTLKGFARVAARAGFSVQNVWTDADRLFSVQYLAC
ncbi:MAG: L-histidine N(alpha)-methyltransferase [Phycisphaerae bacterium]